jgi:hypothetical protein
LEVILFDEAETIDSKLEVIMFDVIIPIEDVTFEVKIFEVITFERALTYAKFAVRLEKSMITLDVAYGLLNVLYLPPLAIE